MCYFGQISWKENDAFEERLGETVLMGFLRHKERRKGFIVS